MTQCRNTLAKRLNDFLFRKCEMEISSSLVVCVLIVQNIAIRDDGQMMEYTIHCASPGYKLAVIIAIFQLQLFEI